VTYIQAEKKYALKNVNPLSTSECNNSDLIVSNIIENIALHKPNRTALIKDSKFITFQELNAKANQIARCLEARGVKQGDKLIIHMPKSFNYTISLLAILKLGAAYITVYPKYSNFRLLYFVSHSKAVAVITSTDIIEDSGLDYDNRIIKFDLLEEVMISMSDKNIGRIIYPEQTAWIYYTSGSTGLPKGVVGTHRATIRRCESMWHFQSTDHNQVVAHQMPISSIDAVWELWAPLAKGIPVLLLDFNNFNNPLHFIEHLNKNKVTQICLVPSLLNILLMGCDDIGKRLQLLKIWVITGEPLTLELAQIFFSRMPTSVLHNQYGLTETIATATCSNVNNSILDSGVISIGEPILHAEIYVLDKDLFQIEAGEVGELYIGGECLAMGYLDAPGLTAQQFIPNPFKDDGECIFRSGDLGEILENGSIKYHGRIDRQIKILGYRIEPAEIEAAMFNIKGVSQAVVLGLKRETGDKIIAGSFVTTKPENITENELLKQLSTKIPHYMLPISLIKENKIPILNNGKINYLEIEKKHNLKLANSKDEILLMNLESVLIGICVKILKISKISINDNFFDKGGDSVLAVILTKYVSDELGVSLSLGEVYQAQTMSEILLTIKIKIVESI